MTIVAKERNVTGTITSDVVLKCLFDPSGIPILTAIRGEPEFFTFEMKEVPTSPFGHPPTHYQPCRRDRATLKAEDGTEFHVEQITLLVGEEEALPWNEWEAMGYLGIPAERMVELLAKGRQLAAAGKAGPKRRSQISKK